MTNESKMSNLTQALQESPDRWRPPVVAAVRTMTLFGGTPGEWRELLDDVARALAPVLDAHDT
jgi:hypothetical protein